jgi:hypothetical protein
VIGTIGTFVKTFLTRENETTGAAITRVGAREGPWQRQIQRW